MREGIYIANAVHNTGRLGAMDLVEVNPQLGDKCAADRTVQAAHNVILAAFGYNERGPRADLPDLNEMT